MRMTKLGHSCVRLERDGQQIVLDPGVWSGADPLAGAQRRADHARARRPSRHRRGQGGAGARSSPGAVDQRRWSPSSSTASATGCTRSVTATPSQRPASTSTSTAATTRHPPGPACHAEHRLRRRRQAVPPWRLVHGPRRAGREPAAADQRAVAEGGRAVRLRASGRAVDELRHPRRGAERQRHRADRPARRRAARRSWAGRLCPARARRERRI